MKLSKDTISILKNFATINSSIKFTPGNVVMTRNSGSIFADAEIDEEIDIDAAVYDLKGFLDILGLTGDEAEVTLDEDQTNFKIKGDRSVIYWPVVDENSLQMAIPKKRINFPEPNVTVDLSQDDLQQLLRVSRALGINTISLSTEDGKILLKGFNKTTDNTLSVPLYSLELSSYDGSNEFTFYINMDNMRMQEKSSYKIKILAAGQSLAAKFEGEHASYVIAVESNSVHDFN